MRFEEFIAARTRPLIGLGIALSQDPGLAEDLVQEVLIKAHARWAKIDRLDDPYGYVRRMLTNEFLSWRRKWARITPVDRVPMADHVPDFSDQHADRAVLMAQLRTLTRRQRAVLALRFYSGLSNREIADALGCGEAAVRSHASRALAALRAAPEMLLPTDEATS